ncbi:porin family protein [Paremcibacter congregatus]|uniref:porin family protein n=1 Tax=Paremcibacter congregatus TaxID=2043170 RepID=UPI0030EEF1F4|tara:strand:+ start:6816 stop:7382 length:567 start_codon:yes stop_codon:yes gene_type:complete
MKKITTALLAGLTALSMTSFAQAQDAGKTFNGAYAGAEVGYNSYEFADNFREDAVYYGAFAGYRVQMDNDLVLGLEGRFGDSSATTDLGISGAEFVAGRQLGVDATIGYALGAEKNVLAYALVGYSNQKITGKLAGVEESNNGDGIRFGLGAEYAVTETISLRATGAYADYKGSANDIQLNAGVLYRF